MPTLLNAVMVVLDCDGLVIVATLGLVGKLLQVPVPTPAIVAVAFWQTFWSGPASGLAVTLTTVVSVHPLTVQI